MGSMGKKSNPDILTRVNEEMSRKYGAKAFGNRLCFVNKNGTPFNVFALKREEEPVFGVEYADNVDDAERGIFEDGDAFYLADYNTLDDMITAMCQEIDNA